MEQKSDESCDQPNCMKKAESQVACLENLVRLLSVLNKNNNKNGKGGETCKGTDCIAKYPLPSTLCDRETSCHRKCKPKSYSCSQVKSKEVICRPLECQNAAKKLTIIKSEDSINNDSLKMCDKTCDEFCDKVLQTNMCTDCYNSMLHLDNVDKKIASLVNVISSYNEIKQRELARSGYTSSTEPLTPESCTHKLCNEDFCQNERCKYSVVNKLMKSVYLLTKPSCSEAKNNTQCKTTEICDKTNHCSYSSCQKDTEESIKQEKSLCEYIKPCVDLNCKDQGYFGVVKPDVNKSYICKRARETPSQSQEKDKVCSKITCPLKNCQNTACSFYPRKNNGIKPLNVGWSSVLTDDAEMTPAEVIEPCTDYDCRNTGCQNTIPKLNLFKSKCSIRNCVEHDCQDPKCPSKPYNEQRHEVPIRLCAGQNFDPCLDYNCQNPNCRNSIKSLNLTKSKCSNLLCSEKKCQEPTCLMKPYRDCSWSLKVCSKGNYYGNRSRYFVKDSNLAEKDTNNLKDKGDITCQISSSMPSASKATKCTNELYKSLGIEPAIAQCNERFVCNKINCSEKPKSKIPPRSITPEHLIKNLVSQSRVCGKTCIAIKDDEKHNNTTCGVTEVQSTADFLSEIKNITSKSKTFDLKGNYRKVITVKVTRCTNPDGTFSEKKKIIEKFLKPKKNSNSFEVVSVKKHDIKNKTNHDEISDNSIPTQPALESSSEKVIRDSFYEPSYEARKNSSTMVHRQRITKAKAQAPQSTPNKFDWATQTDEIYHRLGTKVNQESSSNKVSARTSCVSEESNNKGTCFEDCLKFYDLIPRPKPTMFDKDTCFEHCQKLASKLKVNEPFDCPSCDSPTSVINKILKRDVSDLINSVNFQLAKPEPLLSATKSPFAFLKSLRPELNCAFRNATSTDPTTHNYDTSKSYTQNDKDEKIISDLLVQTFLTSLMTKVLENQNLILKESKNAVYKCAQCQNNNYYFTELIQNPQNDTNINSYAARKISESNQTILCQGVKQNKEKDFPNVCSYCSNDTVTNDVGSTIRISPYTRKCKTKNNEHKETCSITIKNGSSETSVKEKNIKDCLENTVIIEDQLDDGFCAVDRSVTACANGAKDICKKCLLKLSGIDTSRIHPKKLTKCSYCEDLESKESFKSRKQQTGDECAENCKNLQSEDNTWKRLLETRYTKPNERFYSCRRPKKESKPIFQCHPPEEPNVFDKATSTFKLDKCTNCSVKPRKHKCKYGNQKRFSPFKYNKNNNKINKTWNENELNKYFAGKGLVHASNSTRISDRYDVRSLYHMPQNTECPNNCSRQSDPCLSRTVTQCWFSKTYVSKSDVALHHVACSSNFVE